MLTRKRIREILREQGLAPNQVDDVAAYFYSCHLELTEQDVREIAARLAKKGVDHADKKC